MILQIFKLTRKATTSRTSWPLKMGPIGCTETSVQNYQSTLSNIAKECKRAQISKGVALFQCLAPYGHRIDEWYNTSTVIFPLLGTIYGTRREGSEVTTKHRKYAEITSRDFRAIQWHTLWHIYLVHKQNERLYACHRMRREMLLWCVETEHWITNNENIILTNVAPLCC